MQLFISLFVFLLYRSFSHYQGTGIVERQLLSRDGLNDLRYFVCLKFILIVNMFFDL